jgi:hypothetical protein
MTEIDRYRRGVQQSAGAACTASNKEIREIWLTIERSYRLLLDRAERIAREPDGGGERPI